MQRLLLSLAVVFTWVCLAIPANLSAEDATDYFSRGNAWFNKGENDKAIADFDEAIRLNPKLAEAYNNRGNAWEGKGEHDRAIADFGEAIRLNPKYAAAYYHRGGA